MKNSSPMCRCGRTSNSQGYCDGSHAKPVKAINRIYSVLFILVFGFTLQGVTPSEKKILNIEKSSIQWKGKSFVKSSEKGKLSFISGELIFDNKKLNGGKFIVDMASLISTDLSGMMKTKLEGHLKSADFFDVNNHPTSTLNFTKVLKTGKGYQIYADLTIKGITESILFNATVAGDNLKAELKVDRTKFNVKYGSGRFYDGLGDNMIDDEFTLIVNLQMS
jgi:polyisoprenoid-binding protein YceI